MTDPKVTPERYPLHFAVVRVFEGAVFPFDQYSGPDSAYIGVVQNGPFGRPGDRYFLQGDANSNAHCWVNGGWTSTSANEKNPRYSTAFTQDDVIGAVAAFRDLVDNGGSDQPPWPTEAEAEDEDAPGLIIDANGTLSLQMSLRPFVSADDVGLPREQFLALVADRINDDLGKIDGGGTVFVLLWVDTMDVTVEVHATEKSAVDSADKLRRNVPKRASRKFKTADSVNRYMEQHGIIGGIYRRSIAV